MKREDYAVFILLKDTANMEEFYDYLHQWLSYDKRIKEFGIRCTAMNVKK